jgi:hypothetical protein
MGAADALDFTSRSTELIGNKLSCHPPLGCVTSVRARVVGPLDDTCHCNGWNGTAMREIRGLAAVNGKILSSACDAV